MFYLGRGQIMFSMSWKFTIAAALMATLATPALAQRLDRRADLISPQSGRADPGDMVLDIKVTEALPNAFGAPDIFSTSECRMERPISPSKAWPSAVTKPR
jgi:hypothetical protein